MHSRVSEMLEYKKVMAQLSPFASSRLGQEKVEQLQPSYQLSHVRKMINATHEGTTVRRLKEQIPLGGIRDIRPFLKRARIGSVLSPAELLDIVSTIDSGNRLKRFLLSVIDEEEVNLPILHHLAEQIKGLKHLQRAVKRTVNEHGEVVDHASDPLRNIRRGIRGTEREIRKKLEQIVKSNQHQTMLQEAIVTLRQDRYVIPVKQEYRSQFGGIVHDQSASGATVFIEPQAVVSLNHRLREWRLKEEREVERLLRKLTAMVAESHDALQTNVHALAEVDFIFAKASYAEHLQASRPILNDRGVLRLKQARHPLIPPEEVVPIDVRLGVEFTSLVITGPNTGGKTVTLKTIGLLTLMALSGLFIPAEEDSEIAVFAHVFADIGDEQSIEQNLSTFSGHMTNIVRILNDLNPNSLILLDELGAGTDPAEGAALAIALLDYIHQRGCRIVATTHYNELKAYAYNRDQVANANVEFDVKTLRPTYRLLIGSPGRSNAFAIAERLGLPEHIIQIAKAHLGTEQTHVEGMIAALEANRKQAEKDREEAAFLRREVEEMRDKMAHAQRQLQKERAHYRRQAEEEARDIVRKAKREAEQIIRELRQLNERQAQVKEHQLIDLKKRLADQAPPPEGVFQKETAGQNKKVNTADFQVDDEVLVRSLNQKGHVIAILGDHELQVQIGMMKMTVNVDDVERLGKSAAPSESQMTTLNRHRGDVRSELDLRGYNVEEAIQETEKYLDDATLAGLEQVSLIHGKGTGVLRNGIHQFLRTNRYVKKYRLGGQGEGGSGATVVHLK